MDIVGVSTIHAEDGLVSLPELQMKAARWNSSLRFAPSSSSPETQNDSE